MVNQSSRLERSFIKGQGQAAKLLDGTSEFRPNIFRAAIRGHALRIFGGLTDANTADRLVEQLFGGVQGQGTVGLLSMVFQESYLEIETFGQGTYEQPIYKVEGDLIWKLTRSLLSDQQETLTKLIAALTRFAMVFGGFGKSWRRADHRLFYEEYYDHGYNPLIGCHWTWAGERSLIRDVQVRKLEKLGEFIENVRQVAQDWMQLQGEQPHPQNWAKSWREAWHPDKVQVWGRLAESADDCEAIRWLHGPYREAIPRASLPEGSIYQSSVTGKVNQIGRLWHRMYPLIRLVKDPANPAKPKPLLTRQFFELLTFFPDDSPESQAFYKFLAIEQNQFQRLWKQ